LVEELVEEGGSVGLVVVAGVVSLVYRHISSADLAPLDEDLTRG
jgi:hypothetical protein